MCKALENAKGVDRIVDMLQFALGEVNPPEPALPPPHFFASFVGNKTPFWADEIICEFCRRRVARLGVWVRFQGCQRPGCAGETASW